MSKFPCYCDTRNVMAQCVANSRGEQISCHFSEDSDNADRCMWLNPSLNDNCSNPEAHDHSDEHGVVRLEDIPEDNTVLSIDETGNVVENEDRGCRKCILFPCRDVNSIGIEKARKGQRLTEEDLCNLGSLCEDFVDEATFAADVGNLGGGITL